MLDDFKKFVLRGNVVDMAIGVVVGGAFGKIITSLVNDIMMPPLGKLMSGVDFTDWYINLSGGQYANLKEAQAAGAVTLNYGLFISHTVNFLIIAACMYGVMTMMNSLQKKEKVAPAVPPPPPKEQVLLEEIRDLLKTKA